MREPISNIATSCDVAILQSWALQPPTMLLGKIASPRSSITLLVIQTHIALHLDHVIWKRSSFVCQTVVALIPVMSYEVFPIVLPLILQGRMCFRTRQHCKSFINFSLKYCKGQWQLQGPTFKSKLKASISFWLFHIRARANKSPSHRHAQWLCITPIPPGVCRVFLTEKLGCNE